METVKSVTIKNNMLVVDSLRIKLINNILFFYSNNQKIASYSKGDLTLFDTCTLRQVKAINSFINNHVITNIALNNSIFLRYVRIKQPSNIYLFSNIILLKDLLK